MPVTINGTTGIAGVDGSASTPAVQGTDTNTGIFYPAADTIAFAEGGTEVMRLDSNGNVGIGTTSPINITNYKSLTISGTTGGWLEVTNGTVRGIVQNGSADLTVETRSNHPIIFGTNSTERGRFTTSGDFQFNSGYGSVATAYGCRAWVNFNGTGTVAIRGSGNVTSITDNGVGDYTVNFTNAMPDVNYAISSMGRNISNNEITTLHASIAPTTSAVRIRSQSISNYGDNEYMYLSVFR